MKIEKQAIIFVTVQLFIKSFCVVIIYSITIMVSSFSFLPFHHDLMLQFAKIISQRIKNFLQTFFHEICTKA